MQRHGFGGGGKRPEQNEEEEAVVDDLAIAASFAMQQAPCVAAAAAVAAAPVVAAARDENEVDIDTDTDTDDDNDNDNPTIPETDADDSKQGASNGDAASSDDDDESQVDLTEALAHMNDADGDDDDDGPNSTVAPKTQHEVTADPEEAFALSLAERSKLNQADHGGVVVAGHVTSVVKETVIVESGATLLDEGTLLLIQHDHGNDATTWVPIGRIEEVFGPVSRPLYRTRLPTLVPAVPVVGVGVGCNIGDPAEVVQKEDKTETTDDNEMADIPHDETPPPPPPALPDYVALLQSKPVVYYIPDEAKVLDTVSIARKSGKGCDASNVYDEENTNEMYFSDDEQEREFKNRHKKGKNHHRAQPSNPEKAMMHNQQQQHQHQQPHARVPHHRPVPTGFHAPQPSQYPASTMQQQQYNPPMYGYPAPAHATYGMMMYPPGGIMYPGYHPPPPQQPGYPQQQQQQQQAAPPQYYQPQGYHPVPPPPPPPPPPPRPPAATDESDTVYYNNEE